MRRVNIALFSVLSAGLLTGWAMPRGGDSPSSPDPHPPHFHAARGVPADVTLYLHVEHAAAIRRELADRPIAIWFNDTFAAGEAGKVWSQVAESANVDSATLFDALLGRRMTFVLRRTKPVNDEAPSPHHPLTPSPSRAEWALLTEVAAETAEKALAALDPVALGPKSRMAMVELPEHELLIARRGDLLVIGPKENKRLFVQVLRAIGPNPREGETLASRIAGNNIAAQRGRHPSAEVFLAHEPPLGGHSIAVAAFDLHRDIDAKSPNILVRHFGSFNASPFTRRLSKSGVDCSILDVFDEGAALATVEPIDAGRSGLEVFLHAAVGETLLSPKMRENLGERRIVVLGQVQNSEVSVQTSDDCAEGPTSDLRPPTSASSTVPSLAVCYEFRWTPDAPTEFDRQMHALARRLGNRDAEANPPCEQRRPDPNRPRSVEAPLVERFFDGASLNWTIAESFDADRGGWYVISSHADHLDAVVSALSRTEQESVTAGGERWARTPDTCHLNPDTDSHPLHSAGMVHGRGLGHVLRNTPDLSIIAGNEQEQEELRESMRLLADLMLGVERLRWRLTRPSEKEIDLEVRIRLAE